MPERGRGEAVVASPERRRAWMALCFAARRSRWRAMRNGVWLSMGLAVFSGLSAAADLARVGNATLVFATAATGRAILTARDDFVRRLSPFDRAARLHSDAPVSEETFLRHVAASVREWTEEDRARVAAAWVEIRSELDALALPLPATIHLIASTGAEEANAAYTRGTAIVLPPGACAEPPRELAHLLAHELFHILSRHDAALRDRLYAVIGFQPCGELEFPAMLRDLRITNPDAPELRHFITLSVDGRPARAMPILFARTEHYDPARGGEFFDYLQLKLLLVEPGPPGGRTVALFDGEAPRLVDVAETPDFFAQVGHNTQYVIHPEEILADNFALLVLASEGLPSPGIVTKMQQLLVPPAAER